MASTSRARLDPDAAVGLSREDRAALEPLRRSMENFAFVSFARALGGELGFPDFTPVMRASASFSKSSTGKTTPSIVMVILTGFPRKKSSI
jgi:DNA primase